ncbi:hypothetical protein, partial [Embleya sp. NPDC005971]|uniref:hypothetical protein n=1 Tax=Embleya sp. NPDC005971 TaxID=3156724 RepID=UPI0033C2E49B
LAKKYEALGVPVSAGQGAGRFPADGPTFDGKEWSRIGSDRDEVPHGYDDSLESKRGEALGEALLFVLPEPARPAPVWRRVGVGQESWLICIWDAY